jgi:hypothetical protein
MLTTSQAFQLSSKIWLAWCILWLLMAAWSKPSKRREFPWQRLEHVIPLVVGFLLIYKEAFAWRWLAERIIPQNSAVAMIGLALTVGGLLFAVWARIALGANWSGTVTIKSGHNLIRRGPIRQPLRTRPGSESLLPPNAMRAAAKAAPHCTVALCACTQGTTAGGSISVTLAPCGSWLPITISPPQFFTRP